MDGILRRNRFEGSYLVAPVLERLPETVKDLDFLVRAIVTGDLLYAAPVKRRRKLAPEKILSWTELFSLAQTIGELETTGRKIAVVGTPMCLAGLDNGVLDTLDAEGNTVYRAPLAEYLCWRNNICRSFPMETEDTAMQRRCRWDRARMQCLRYLHAMKTPRWCLTYLALRTMRVHRFTM